MHVLDGTSEWPEKWSFNNIHLRQARDDLSYRRNIRGIKYRARRARWNRPEMKRMREKLLGDRGKDAVAWYMLMDNRISVTVPTSRVRLRLLFRRIKINSISRRERNHPASHIIISHFRTFCIRSRDEYRVRASEDERKDLILMKLDATVGKAVSILVRK